MTNKKLICAAALTVALSMPSFALAESASDTKYYYDDVVNTGLDNGYSDSNAIKDGDPHFGWTLGRFVVSGFTGRVEGDTPTFLKTVGDQVKLSFVLDQDIDALNGDETKKISQDKNGYDQYFQVPKSDFGRGTLIVRHTNYQNSSTAPQEYKDYLPALKVGAETEVGLFEEGDYEVALDYEIESPGFMNNPVLPHYENYRVYFSFKVRNGDTIVYLFDTETGGELFNGQVTESGFRIDTGGSNYLDISVKKEILNEARDGLVEDVRFNRTAKNGSEFKEPGIYTVTVRNNSSNDEPTTKVIYVGDDDLLKASVANGLSISEVQRQLDAGATVTEDGMLVQASATVESGDAESGEEAASIEETQKSDAKKSSLPIRPVFIALLAAAIIVAVLRVVRGGRKKPEAPIENAPASENEEGDEL